VERAQPEVGNVVNGLSRVITFVSLYLHSVGTLLEDIRQISSTLE